MKINLPTQDLEYVIEPGISIVSKTDLRGVITYANDSFIAVSGFTREELIGKSHNIVRHPDMPAQAFADMWKILKSGQPWKGIVKNRCKDGRYYWVEACVVPIRKDDQTIGYMSVRQKARDEDIAAAETLYGKLRDSGAELPQPKLKNLMTIRAGFVMGSLFVVALMVAGGVLGIGGLHLSNSSADTLYRQLLNPVASLGKVNVLLAETKSVLENERLDTKLHPGNKEGTPLSLKDDRLAARLLNHRHEIDRLLGLLAGQRAGSGNDPALDDFLQKYRTFAESVLIPFETLLNTGLDRPHLENITARLDPLYQSLNEASIALEQSLLTSAEHDYQGMRQRNELIWKIALAGILFGITMVVVVGRIFMRDIVRPLDDAIYAFDRIAQGDLTHEVNIYGKGETGQLIRASATMQLHLKVIMDEVSLVTSRIYSYCRHLNNSLLEVSEHTEEQHHRVYQAKDAVDTAAQEAASVSIQVEGLLSAVEQVKVALGENLTPVEAPMANLEQQIADLATILRVQAFAADEVALKMHQIASLIVENRQQTQDAYAVSEQVKQVADELKSLVSYFDTRNGEDSDGPSV